MKDFDDDNKIGFEKSKEQQIASAKEGQHWDKYFRDLTEKIRI